MKKSLRALLLVGGMLLYGSQAVAQQPDPKELQTRIEKAMSNYIALFDQRDAGKLAELFTPEAEYIDIDGVVFHGQKVIEGEFKALFETTPPVMLQLNLISIRPIAENVLVHEGVARHIDEKGEFVSGVHYSATHVRVGDKWLMASVREIELEGTTPHQHLETLSWLLGAWREEAGGTATSTTWKWSEDGQFLLADFVLKDVTGVAMKGSHRVGWDAGAKQFRSWVFDSTGGSATGLWSVSDEGVWSVNLSGVDAMGVGHSSLLTYRGDGADGLIISQDLRTRGGQTLPGMTHHVVRQPPEPGRAASR
jgi:uncharacterized protein (TIGR02246 family)